MTLEHLSQSQLTRYSGRTLDPPELLEVDSHLASCDVCHERLTRIFPGAVQHAKSASFDLSEEPFHLDYEQHLEPYVDGTANDIDREIVDSHVALCSKCATDLEDLLEFKRQPVAAVADEARTESWWTKWWPQFLPANPAWATAVVVVAVFALAAAVIWWTRPSASVPAQQAAATVPPAFDSPAGATEQPSPASSTHAPAKDPRSAEDSRGYSFDSMREEPLLALYDAGGEIILDQRGRLEGLRDLPPDLKETIERTLVARQFRASPALRGWSGDTNNLRSRTEPQNTFGPVFPTDVVIESDQPTFRWRPLEAAQNYVVTVYDDKFRKVSTSDPVSVTEWTTPKSLARGVTYSWQISASKGDETVVAPKPPAPQARFRVLDQRAIAVLTKLKEAAQRSHLAIGVFYWKHGLLAESEREFQALAAANPNSTVVKELLQSLRSIRGP